MHWIWTCLAFTILLSGLPSETVAITLGQIDDFEDGSTQGWADGLVSPNPPVNVSDGGPEGAGDAYLEDSSSGQGQAGSKLILMNGGQWIGDYLAANVNAIRLWLRNTGTTALTMRMAFEGAATHYGTEGFPLPADGEWHLALFHLDALLLIGGTATPEQTLSAVNAVRLLAAAGGPSWTGDLIAATVGIDDITALHLDVPTEPTTWGALKSRFAGPERR